SGHRPATNGRAERLALAEPVHGLFVTAGAVFRQPFGLEKHAIKPSSLGAADGPVGQLHHPCRLVRQVRREQAGARDAMGDDRIACLAEAIEHVPAQAAVALPVADLPLQTRVQAAVPIVTWAEGDRPGTEGGGFAPLAVLGIELAALEEKLRAVRRQLDGP